MDFTILYKTSYEDGNIDTGQEYDYFISGYDDCERTKTIFHKIKAKQKVWIDFPHYHIDLTGIADVYKCNSHAEDEAFIGFFETYNLDPALAICIDITGFIRPHLIYLVVYLYRKGFRKMDFLYSEPQHYKDAEETNFSGFIDDVKIIEGCSSFVNKPDVENDLLIITAGYDDKLIAYVSKYKAKIRNKFYILGFPSLQPDMYQESILQMYNVKDAIGPIKNKFAPANDPFVTAQVISEIIDSLPNTSNIYLSPLSTKPQALGIVFYYLWNFKSKSINIVFPYSKTYNIKTAVGIKKTWKYTFEIA